MFESVIRDASSGHELNNDHVSTSARIHRSLNFVLRRIECNHSEASLTEDMLATLLFASKSCIFLYQYAYFDLIKNSRTLNHVDVSRLIMYRNHRAARPNLTLRQLPLQIKRVFVDKKEKISAQTQTLVRNRLEQKRDGQFQACLRLCLMSMRPRCRELQDQISLISVLPA